MLGFANGGYSMLPGEDIFRQISLDFIHKILGIDKALRFVGEIRQEHKTKFAFQETAARYKLSVKSINRAISTNLGFAFLALYAFWALPPTGSFKLPYIGVEISREIWISIVPTIGYGLQIWVVIAMIWFILLRIRLRRVIKERGKEDDFGDITEVYLSGIIGQIWIASKVADIYDSRLNYLWIVPAIIFFTAIILSPLLTLGFFVVQLFIFGKIVFAILYTIFLLPYSIFFLMLLYSIVILSTSEFWIQFEKEVDSRIQIIKRVVTTDTQDGTGKPKEPRNR